MTRHRPHVRKVGPSWRVYINDRMWYSTPRFTVAIERAHGIARYALHFRLERDLARTSAAIARMEQNR